MTINCDYFASQRKKNDLRILNISALLSFCLGAFAQTLNRGFREIFSNFFSNFNQKEGKYIDSRGHSENVEN